MNNQVSPERFLQLGTGFWASRAFLSAVELGVFSVLAKGPREFGALAAELKLHPRSSRDFLDTLVALRILERRGEVYSNTPEADLFLDRAKGSYIGGLFELCGERLYGAWDGLTVALRTGEPQNGAEPGHSPFEALYADEKKLRNFLGAMTGISLPAAKVIAAKFPWKEHKTFFDVGCAQGATPVQVALEHPHLSGGGFDLPAVGPVFRDYVAAHGLEGRLRFIAGDMFKDPWPKADVLIMGHILHDWSLKQKRELLAKAYAALPAGGALIVYEAIIDDERRENAFGLLMSLNMLIETPEGFDYSGADCQGWMRDAGFRQTRVEHLAGPDSMVIGVK